MDIAITGSHGFIGTALTGALTDRGHRVLPVSRSAAAGQGITWDPTAGRIDADRLEGVDAVVHLAGEGIASRPWSEEQRARIEWSRSEGTDLLARTLAALDRKPSVLVSGSAIGYYGDRGDEVLRETSAPGDDFLAHVCIDWEAATEPARAAGIRVATIRTGIVLDASGGALAKQLLPFKLGLGAKAGDGRQWMSWISLADEVAAIVHLLETDGAAGPFNLTAPEPVTNAAFTDAVGEALHRPTFLTIPRAVRHVPFGVGDLAHSLLFCSQRVLPEALESTGFEFRHRQLPEALADVLG